jgi:hypothetical protein
VIRLATAEEGMAIRVNAEIGNTRGMAMEGGAQGKLLVLISYAGAPNVSVRTKGEASICCFGAR